MLRVFPPAEIIGVDIDPGVNPDILIDALVYIWKHGFEFDFIWASPPCQKYSPSSCSRGREYPGLLTPTIRLLDRVGKPYCVENVMGARTFREHDVILRGYNFENLRDMRRPRKFWTSFSVPKPPVYEKVFPYYRLISGGGGWIREPEKVLRMSVKDVEKRWGIKGTLKQVAQIVLPEYAQYIMESWKETIQ